ncbi:hypothetical protein A6E01_19490 (plasmid) [Vibrio breoganii]|uniref:DHHA1 domain-containing protein n=1 Tax=Vibrio breoganii TaxID=553239 RepID=A0AAN0XZB3_9VIBR|nr:hypothetical protein [Vibrio breoganii]ANO35399.1 hypothetical protein A6E01_19490 [Vibrio breoganii]PML12676.1 hypothetical protein BCT84_02000 [Vibrio breoganii]
MKKVAVLHHSIDVDGTFSGLLAKNYFEQAGCKVTTVGINYGYDFDEIMSKVEDGTDIIVMTDFTMEREDCLTLIGREYDIRIYDHHETSYKHIIDLYNDGLITGCLDLSRCGTKITWDELFGQSNAEQPWYIDVINDHDLWTHELPNTKEIVLAAESYPMTIEGAEEAISLSKESLIEKGRTLTSYQEQLLAAADNTAYEVIIDGVKCICAHSLLALRSVQAARLHALYPDHDVVILMTQRVDGFTTSVRGHKDKGVNILPMLERAGGGGHKYAGGAKIQSLEDFGTEVTY